MKGSHSGAGISINDSNVSLLNCKLKQNHNHGAYIPDTGSGQSFLDAFNCTFLQNWTAGVYTEYPQFSAQITDCIFDGNNVSEYGLYFVAASTIEIQDSRITNNDMGIYCADTDLTMADCRIKSNDIGLYCANS